MRHHPLITQRNTFVRTAASPPRQKRLTHQFELYASLLACVFAFSCGGVVGDDELDSYVDTDSIEDVDAESEALVSGAAWKPIDISFRAAGTPDWRSSPLTVHFTHSSGTKIKAEGFWDGGKKWKVRFAPTKAGRWTWSSTSSDSGLNAKKGTITATEPTHNQVNANPNYRGHLRVASDDRTFNRADGTPFFYLGDTGWSFGSAEFSKIKNWIDDRKDKGFTLLQVRYVTATRGNEGGYPYPKSAGGTNNGDFSEINAGFFKGLDKRMKYAFDRGFVVAGHPEWMLGPRKFNLVEAENLSRYLLARYGAYPLVWSLTGEYQSANGTDPYWEANNYGRLKQLGNFVESKNFYGHPVSVHPGGSDTGAPTFSTQSSAHHFHGQAWLNHNWLQTYLNPEKIPFRIHEALSYSPLKPVVLSEGQYEAVPKLSAPADLQRRQVWGALLSGAAGFVYGAYGLFFFTDMTRLDLPGSTHMARVSAFFRHNSIPLSALNPKVAGGKSCVKVNGADANLLSSTHARCAGTSGKTYVLYAPVGSEGHTLELRGLAHKSYIARWYNPATGTYVAVNEGRAINTDRNDTWPVPSRPSKSDWVLWLTAQ